MTQEINWDTKNIVKINRETYTFAEGEEIDKLFFRKKIEPWLAAVFQSEHLSLLVGSGLTTATTHLAGANSQGMNRLEFTTYKDEIKRYSESMAKKKGRGISNFEDDMRTAYELLSGLKIINDIETSNKLEEEINNILSDFLRNILDTEKNFLSKLEESTIALNYLKSFLMTFASRTASRERLHIFTTNYDRFIEFGLDMSGIITLDKFIGKIKPIYRSSKLELDYHYNPPGIRGEPRYVEGVVRLTKLHGSIDWRFEEEKIVKAPLQFGDEWIRLNKEGYGSLVIYPNSSKDLDTSYYPYADLFRDFSYASSRPNSVLVTYGYSFGDSHINRIIEDMLTIPSTHLVIISYDDSSGRIKAFFEKHNASQFTLLIGDNFGDLKNLVDYFLPKSAIDRISIRSQEIKTRRGESDENGSEGKIKTEDEDDEHYTRL